MPAWLFYPALMTTVIAAGMMYWRGDPVAAAVIAVLSMTAYSCFRIGIGQVTAGLVAIAAAVYFAPVLGRRYEDLFAQYTHTSGLASHYGCMIAIGVLISLVTVSIGGALISRFLYKRPRLKRLDACGGLVIGIAEGAAVILLVLGAALSGQLWLRTLNQENEPTELARMIDNTAAMTRQSILGDTIRDLNPFEHFEPLTQVGDLMLATQRLKDPDEVARLLNDPRIKQLNDDPDFSAALKELRRDPVIQKLADENQPVDGAAFAHLLNSPEIRTLFDQPAFLQTARDVLLDQER